MRPLLLALAAALLARGAAGEPYSGEMRFQWSASSFPDSYPAGAHWSPPVGAVHNSSFTLYAVGGTASPGVEAVAETGSTSTVRAEINAAEGAVAVVGPGSGNVGASATYAFSADLTAEHPLLSIVSMVAPSPDWFAGASGLSVLNETTGALLDEVEVNMYALDAGTDSGSTYTASNDDTLPQQAIEVIAGAPFSGQLIGTVRLTRDAASDTDTDTDSDGEDGDDSPAAAAAAGASAAWLAACATAAALLA